MLVYWPGLNTDVQQYIVKCQTCTNNMPSNSKEPVINHNIEILPWQKVVTNLFKWKSASFLVTINYHSCFFEIEKLPMTSSSAVITKLKAHFAQHGIPSQLMSDNRPQFTSREFTNFAKMWGVKKVVQISKNIMMKATENTGYARV